MLGVRLQTTIVVILFLASLSTVVISTLQTLYLPHGEEQIQNRLREASRRMADAAESEIASVESDDARTFDDLNSKLRQVTERTLRDFAGVEGGFYLSDGVGRFAGFGFPTREQGEPTDAQPTVKSDRAVAFGDDPPPRETQFIFIHEVRNPLAGIRSTVQLWDRLPETMQNAGSMEAVIHAVDRLNEIVTRLLYFSRADSSERQLVQINQLLVETLELVKAQAASQQVIIDCDFADDVPGVSGAANALRQVFLNLATNALQAMPRGGRLRCFTRCKTAAKMVEIRFEDTGLGITPDNQKHLFEPFFTTRPEGTGLGLALCREIVLQHGSQIELVSSSGSGTAFRVLLSAIS